MKIAELLTESITDWDDFAKEITDEVQKLLGRDLKTRWGDCFSIALALFLAAKKRGVNNVVIIGDNGPHVGLYVPDEQISLDGTGVYPDEGVCEHRPNKRWKTAKGYLKFIQEYTTSESQNEDLKKVLEKFQ